MKSNDEIDDLLRERSDHWRASQPRPVTDAFAPPRTALMQGRPG